MHFTGSHFWRDLKRALLSWRELLMLLFGGKEECRQLLLAQPPPWDLCCSAYMEWGDKLFDGGIARLRVSSIV